MPVTKVKQTGVNFDILELIPSCWYQLNEVWLHTVWPALDMFTLVQTEDNTPTEPLLDVESGVKGLLVG